MKQNRLLVAAVILLLIAATTALGVEGGKRLILTSGEKVYAIHYVLGQSTVLFFGLKPETVICGNRNYFNIENVKGGITVQPLGHISTNLTIMDGRRRFLFFLTPAAGNGGDGFVDVRWVPPGAAVPVKPAAAAPRAIHRKVQLGGEAEITVEDEKLSGGRRILELTLRNASAKPIGTKDISVAAARRGNPLPGQTTVWAESEAKPGQSLPGRLIVTGEPAWLLLTLHGRHARIELGH